MRDILVDLLKIFVGGETLREDLHVVKAEHEQRNRKPQGDDQHDGAEYVIAEGKQKRLLVGCHEFVDYDSRTVDSQD